MLVYTPIKEILAPEGLHNPDLEALFPNASLYTVALFQPKGVIASSPLYVRNANPDEALKHRRFFQKCFEEDVALAVTPEYSTPWSVLKECLENDCFPSEGKLWVVGLESSTIDELNAFKTRFDISHKVFKEDIFQNQANFLDPICYMFRTRDEQNELVKVILFQFKTNQMGGVFERDNLILGSKVYVLTRPDEKETLKIVTLVCADTLGMNIHEAVRHMGSRTLVLHLQLNEDPRSQIYSAYRNALFNAEDTTEIICLNWASDVECDGEVWNNISGSALYMKSTKMNLSDERVNPNHAKGLYYTYMKRPKVSAYFFNYDEHIFIFRTTKPWQGYVPHQQKIRSGPEMTQTFSFNENSEIIPVIRAEDNFNKWLNEFEGNFTSLRVLEGSPTNIERLLELTLGKAKKNNWSDFQEISFFIIEDNEILNRVSYAQEKHADGVRRRSEAIRSFSMFSEIIERGEINFPVEIASLKNNSQIRLQKSSNLLSLDGSEAATVLYLGENPRQLDVEFAYSKISSILKEENLDTRRIVVWYRRVTGELSFFPPSANHNVDNDENEESVSIDRS